jgi:hypothetical protein
MPLATVSPIRRAEKSRISFPLPSQSALVHLLKESRVKYLHSSRLINVGSRQG